MVGAKEEDEEEIDFFFDNELNDRLDLMNYLIVLQFDAQCVLPVTTQDKCLITGHAQKIEMKENVIIAKT